MRQIILDLLEFSKLDNFQEEKSWMNTQEIVDKSKLRGNVPIIHIQVLPEIYGHKRMMVQLFQNIISNAIKSQPSGQTPEIWISCKADAYYWEFSIKANGISLEKDY